MPKLKQKQKPFDPIAEKILGRMALRGVYMSDLEGPLISESTLRRRMRSPGSFKLDEILYLARRLEIQPEEIWRLLI